MQQVQRWIIRSIAHLEEKRFVIENYNVKMIFAKIISLYQSKENTIWRFEVGVSWGEFPIEFR